RDAGVVEDELGDGGRAVVVDAEDDGGDERGVDLDAGTLACKPLRPVYIDPSFIAPVVLRINDHGPAPVAQLVFNDTGIPQIVTVPTTPPDASDDSTGVVTGRTKSTLPSCAAAADVLYCPDASGAVHAWHGETGSIVAHARAGTDIAAAAFGGHVALAYLAERQTSEGIVREAWVVLDDGAPVRLSEDGSGATFVELAPRGTALLAMTIDARTAMTPAHARPLSVEDGKLSLGPDAVVFVGGSAERHNAGALAIAKDGSAFELIAVADGASAFGMAAIRVEQPPREDEPVVWSLYPNGLDPAPIAATHGGATMVIARVRPRTADPKSSRVLEIGELSREGAFAPSCIIDEAPFIKDVEVELDRQGALWVFYRDPRGSVLERRTFPGLGSIAGLPSRR
ncbi:MAG: hypothetical protein ACLQBL_05795, partial [Polyangiaceae bacterium]